jgi:hypothetical protein
VTVYGAIRSYTEENGDCIRPPCTKTVNDRFFLCISLYVSVYDTEIYDRSTITCKPSYISVYGRLRPCLFDLGEYYVHIPRSNMHGRKRPFTEKNGDIRRSYTVSVHGHRIRSETVRNGFRIQRSYKNTE